MFPLCLLFGSKTELISVQVDKTWIPQWKLLASSSPYPAKRQQSCRQKQIQKEEINIKQAPLASAIHRQQGTTSNPVGCVLWASGGSDSGPGVEVGFWKAAPGGASQSAADRRATARPTISCHTAPYLASATATVLSAQPLQHPDMTVWWRPWPCPSTSMPRCLKQRLQLGSLLRPTLLCCAPSLAVGQRLNKVPENIMILEHVQKAVGWGKGSYCWNVRNVFRI